MVVPSRARSRRKKKVFRKKRRTFKPTQRALYGITKTVNHGGFHAFKEKNTHQFSLTAVRGPTEMPDTVSSCCGGFGSNFGISHCLNGAFPITNNVFTCRQYRSYSELFEYWRITGVKVTLMPNSDVKTVSANVAGRQIPTLWYYSDSNKGQSTPLNIDIVTRKSRVKYRRFNKPISVFYQPKISQIMVQDPTSAVALGNETYVPKVGSNDWIPTTATSGYEPGLTKYGGFHWGLITNNTAAGTVIPINVIVTTYYEFKGNK